MSPPSSDCFTRRIRKHEKNRLLKWIRRFWVPFVFIICPPPIILLAGRLEWIARIFTFLVVLPAAVVAVFWYGLSPKTQIIKPGAKLNRQEFGKKWKTRVTIIGRALFCLTGLIILFGLMVPFTIDIALLLSGDKPIMVSGRTIDNETFFGFSFIYQNIRFETDAGAKKHYFLLYSAKPRLRRNAHYEFLALPRSKLVLQARELKGNGE